MSTPQPPAGWYPDPDDGSRQRYWDGDEWTEDRVDYRATTPGQATGPVSSAGGNRRALFIVGGLVVALVLIVGGVALTFNGQETTAPQPLATVTAPMPTSGSPSPAPTESESPADEDYYPWPSSYSTLTERQWKKIVRDPDRFAGKGVIVYANVFQFDAATGRKAFLAYASNQDETSYGFWDGDDTVAFVSPDRRTVRNVVEDDVVRVKAVVDSSYSYETQIGGNTTVPLLYIDKIQVIGSTD